MGSCGCGDGFGDFKFPGPDGIMYAVHVYPGCTYCRTGAGVSIYRYASEDWRRETEDIPDLPWWVRGEGLADRFIPVISEEAIRAHVKALAEGLGETVAKDAKHGDVWTAEEFADALTENVVPDVTREIMNEWLRATRDGAPPTPTPTGEK